MQWSKEAADRFLAVASAALSIVAIVLVGVYKSEVDQASNDIRSLNLDLARSQLQVSILSNQIQSLNVDRLVNKFDTLTYSSDILNASVTNAALQVSAISESIRNASNITTRLQSVENSVQSVQSSVSTLNLHRPQVPSALAQILSAYSGIPVPTTPYGDVFVIQTPNPSCIYLFQYELSSACSCQCNMQSDHLAMSQAIPSFTPALVNFLTVYTDTFHKLRCYCSTSGCNVGTSPILMAPLLCN